MRLVRYMIVCALLMVLLAACGQKQESAPAAHAADTLAQESAPPQLPQTVRPEAKPARPAPPERPAQPAAPAAERKTAGIDELPGMIDAHRDRLNRIYRKHLQMLDMGGRVEFSIEFNEDGGIALVQSTPSGNAQFSEEFLAEARADIAQWNLPVSGVSSYSFRMTFMK